MKIINDKDKYLYKGMFEYPIGYILSINNNKYIVREAGSMKCQSCAFDEDLQRCFENRCSSNRRDGKRINFKSLGTRS